MPVNPVLFNVGLVIALAGLIMLAYAAWIRRKRGVASETDPWWWRLLEWLYQKLGAMGVVGALIFVVGLFLMVWGWNPDWVVAVIQWLADNLGNNEESPPPTPPESPSPTAAAS